MSGQPRVTETAFAALGRLGLTLPDVRAIWRDGRSRPAPDTPGYDLVSLPAGALAPGRLAGVVLVCAPRRRVVNVNRRGGPRP